MPSSALVSADSRMTRTCVRPNVQARAFGVEVDSGSPRCASSATFASCRERARRGEDRRELAQPLLPRVLHVELRAQTERRVRSTYRPARAEKSVRRVLGLDLHRLVRVVTFRSCALAPTCRRDRSRARPPHGSRRGRPRAAAIRTRARAPEVVRAADLMGSSRASGEPTRASTSMRRLQPESSPFNAPNDALADHVFCSVARYARKYSGSFSRSFNAPKERVSSTSSASISTDFGTAAGVSSAAWAGTTETTNDAAIRPRPRRSMSKPLMKRRADRVAGRATGRRRAREAGV
jgi:hypothetical protein